MAEVKTVRLANTKTGVVVTTSEDNAARLTGFEPVKKAAKATEKPEQQ